MLFIFFLLIVAGVIGYFTWRATDTKNKIDFFAPFLISSAVGLALLFVIWGTSYSTYLSAKTFFDGTKEQYASAVIIYSDYAEIDLRSAAWTDLKYQGYQENMASFINNFRRKIVNYNKEIISKRVMDKNPIFSWLIVAPDDDMVVIKMANSLASETKGLPDGLENVGSLPVQ